jgi:hypothetical protein
MSMKDLSSHAGRAAVLTVSVARNWEYEGICEKSDIFNNPQTYVSMNILDTMLCRLLSENGVYTKHYIVLRVR